MASKNIVLKETTYNGVESITLPTSPSGTATFVEVSDTTAIASDVLNSKYFYTAAGVKTQGTGIAPSPTLITKNITVNGTYDAEDDDADGYSSVTVSVSGGGGDSWSWMGKNPTKVKTCLDRTDYLEDTAYASWTPSGTGATLADASTLNAETLSSSDYDAILIYRFHAHLEYGAGGTTGNKMLGFYYVSASAYTGRSSSNAAWSAGTDNSCGISTGNTLATIRYLNSSGVENYNTNISYGVYVAGAPNHTYSVSDNTFTLTPKTPIVYMRCSSTYFSTANAAVVDQSASYYHQLIELWKVDKGTSLLGAQQQILNEIWTNDDFS